MSLKAVNCTKTCIFKELLFRMQQQAIEYTYQYIHSLLRTSFWCSFVAYEKCMDHCKKRGFKQFTLYEKFNDKYWHVADYWKKSIKIKTKTYIQWSIAILATVYNPFICVLNFISKCLNLFSNHQRLLNF